VHLVKEHRQAAGTTIAAKRPAQVTTRSRGNRNWLGRDFNGDDFLALEWNHRNARCQRRSGSVCDERDQEDRISSTGFVAGSGAGNTAIVFDADQQPGRRVGGTICQADDRFNQVIVRQGAALFTFELDIERFTVPG
jgi:hypothetical protein